VKARQKVFLTHVKSDLKFAGYQLVQCILSGERTAQVVKVYSQIAVDLQPFSVIFFKGLSETKCSQSVRAKIY
jgi:hypothetical protein